MDTSSVASTEKRDPMCCSLKYPLHKTHYRPKFQMDLTKMELNIYTCINYCFYCTLSVIIQDQQGCKGLGDGRILSLLLLTWL